MAQSSFHTHQAVQPWAVLLAAGAGLRMQCANNTPKQFLSYQGMPLYWRSARTISRCACIGGIVFVFPQQYLAQEQERLQTLANTLGIPWRITAGGARRQDSVWQGLCALPAQCTHVFIHDAARPFASAALWNRVNTALEQGAMAVIPAIPVADTVKVVHEGCVQQTLPRDTLRAVQTPQAFAVNALRKAHELAQHEHITVTDDAALLEQNGCCVVVVAGEKDNSKITTPEDLQMLQPAHQYIPCVGYGYDVHRFGKGRPLRLGGIPIDGELEVIAHSDGDVLLHALMDAILGCAGAGDIGQHFPDTDARFANADSSQLLDDVLRIAYDAGVTLTHADLTIITQKPKIAPHRNAIQKRIATLLSLDIHAVNLKATTEEGLGFTGQGHGIKAVAVVSALRTSTPCK